MFQFKSIIVLKNKTTQISNGFFLDLVPDCVDGADEDSSVVPNCNIPQEECSEDQFQCHNGRCINKVNPQSSN